MTAKNEKTSETQAPAEKSSVEMTPQQYHRHVEEAMFLYRIPANQLSDLLGLSVSTLAERMRQGAGGESRFLRAIHAGILAIQESQEASERAAREVLDRFREQHADGIESLKKTPKGQ